MTTPTAPACADCGGPATVWRDIGRNIAACHPCEDASRARSLDATRFTPLPIAPARAASVLVCPHGCKPCWCGSGDPACLCWNDHAASATETFPCGCTEEEPCPEHTR